MRKRLLALAGVLVMTAVVPAQAQTTGPIRVITSGIKTSVGSTACPSPQVGTCIPAYTVMANTGLMTEDTSWAVMFQCSGAPVQEGNPPVFVGGDGVYTYERYNALAILDEPVQVVHDPYGQGGTKSIPGPIQAPSATVGFPILIVHKALFQGGTQSIPPISLQAGEGLRIRTTTALKGALSCAIFMYIF